MNELLEQLQNGIASIPDNFGEGDEIVAAVTPDISQLLTQTKSERTELESLLARRDSAKKGIKDLSDNISILAQETVRSFKKPEIAKSEIDEIKEALQATQGRSLF